MLGRHSGTFKVVCSVGIYEVVHDFTRLQVWDEAIELGLVIYRITQPFPAAERFGLRAQMRSAAVSVSSNIAEGAGRGGAREMAWFLRVALGSLSEIRSQLELARRLGYLDEDLETVEAVRRLSARILRLHDSIAGVDR